MHVHKSKYRHTYEHNKNKGELSWTFKGLLPNYPRISKRWVPHPLCAGFSSSCSTYMHTQHRLSAVSTSPDRHPSLPVLLSAALKSSGQRLSYSSPTVSVCPDPEQMGSIKTIAGPQKASYWEEWHNGSGHWPGHASWSLALRAQVEWNSHSIRELQTNYHSALQSGSIFKHMA